MPSVLNFAPVWWPRWRPLSAALTGATMLVCWAVAAAQPQTRADYLRRFDTDGDGRVSLSEYQAYMSRGFRAMDRNHDGVLSASELPPGVRWRGPITLEAHLRALARTFDLLDVNNDGYLDADELTAPPP